jgi:hypothetical protein
MLFKSLTLFAIPLALAVIGCKQEPPAPAPTKAPAHAAESKAEPAAEQAGVEHGHGAVPGSHEDWCGEHGVAESQCTRCNPKLVSAFKATGDWCGDHGLPKSQCIKCDPNLKIVRPPKAAN